MDRIFPENETENQVICVPGIGGKTDFSVLITDKISDRGYIGASHCFPRYWYPKPNDTSNGPDASMDMDEAPEKIDNITDTALQDFQAHYEDMTICKESIFNYVYGILHAPDYREQFAYDFTKMLPRIPFAPDFWDICKGRV